VSWALSGLARSFYFPQRRLISQFQFQHSPQLKQKALIEIKTRQLISDSSHAPNLPTALQSAAVARHTEQQRIPVAQTAARLKPLAGNHTIPPR
jgi:hypothetical protein